MRPTSSATSCKSKQRNSDETGVEKSGENIHTNTYSTISNLYIIVTMEICHVTFWDCRVPHSLHHCIEEKQYYSKTLITQMLGFFRFKVQTLHFGGN